MAFEEITPALIAQRLSTSLVTIKHSGRITGKQESDPICPPYLAAVPRVTDFCATCFAKAFRKRFGPLALSCLSGTDARDCARHSCADPEPGKKTNLCH